MQRKTRHASTRLLFCLGTSSLLACGTTSDLELGSDTRALSSGLEDALACIEGYAQRNACDWAHWSELYEVCRSYEHETLDDGYFIDEVRAGRCTAASFPALRQTLATRTFPSHSPVGEGADLSTSLACVAGFAEVNECDWQHWTELYLTCRTYEHAKLDDGYLLEEVRAGRCTRENFAAIAATITGEEATSEEEAVRLSAVFAPQAALVEDGQLVISQEEWFTIQRYVTFSLALPRTDAAVRARLGMTEQEDFAPFVALRESFSSVYAHATDWEQRIMPGTVDLALDLVNYAESVPFYYQPLRDAIQVLRTRPNDAQARQDFLELAQALGDEASFYEQRAKAVEESMHAFATTLEGDGVALASLRTDYERRFGEENGEVNRIRAQIETSRQELAKANADYDQACKIAGTSPVYAWAAFPYGLITAAIVSGVYGDRAVRALNRIHQLEDEIADLGQREARLHRLLSSITAASGGLTEIRDAISAALPTIQTIRRSWDDMHADLEKIVRLMTNDIQRAAPVVKNVQLDIALDQWRQVSDKANAYVTHAYIKVEAP